MSKQGGRRPGAGRPKGSLNKVTKAAKATIGELARNHADEAVGVLLEIARSGTSESARVAAANAILDRGYGRPGQAMELTGANGKDLVPDRPAGVLIVPNVMTEEAWEKMMAEHQSDRRS